VTHKPGSALLIVLLAFGVMFGTLSGPRPTGAQSPSPTPCGNVTCPFVPLPEPKLGQFDRAAVAAVDLKSYPILPKIPGHVLDVYQEGLRRGNNPRVFSKVGDCMTATPDFMEPFGKGDYALGDYATLQKVIDYYAGVPARGKDNQGKAADFDSFINPGLAATSGFNAASVLDATWNDPKWCKSSESPLACEYRVSKPSIAIIMFGTNDLKSITPEQFDFYLRTVVVQTYNAGIVPILSTFPMQPGADAPSLLYNQITAKIATDYDLPLINLWLALEPLPYKGVDPENSTHMTKPSGGHSGSLAEADLQAGYNVRNLVTLQTMEAILQAVAPDALK
jgi:hypothetical protein